MKQCILRRSLPALLCLTLAMSLTACGRQTGSLPAEGGGSTAGALSGSKGNVSEPKGRSRRSRESGGGTCPAAGVYGRG